LIVVGVTDMQGYAIKCIADNTQLYLCSIVAQSPILSWLQSSKSAAFCNGISIHGIFSWEKYSFDVAEKCSVLWMSSTLIKAIFCDF
jgi:hypothetical protein